MKTDIPSWTTDEEINFLEKLAHDVPGGGLIVEIGALYGGATAVMASSNLKAKIISIDNFSWTPEGYPPVSRALMQSNLDKLGITNVEIVEGDSRRVGKKWDKPIDLLWVDGGHSYEFVYADLMNFGPSAQVIACHDYDNPFWPTIKQAIGDFLSKHPEFYLTHVRGTVAVLQRTS